MENENMNNDEELNNNDLNENNQGANEELKETVQEDAKEILQNDKKETIVSEPPKPSRMMKHLKKAWGYYLILLVLLASNLYWWGNQNSLIRKHENKLTETKQDYTKKANAFLVENTQKQLHLTMQALVWSVRSAMMRKNFDEIDQYFLELVHNPDIKELFLVNNDNKEIMLASNKKHEKMNFGELYNEKYLLLNNINFDEKDGFYLLSAPVMSLDKRLGTLFMVVGGHQIEFEGKQSDSALPKEKVNENLVY